MDDKKRNRALQAIDRSLDFILIAMEKPLLGKEITGSDLHLKKCISTIQRMDQRRSGVEA